MKKTLSVLTVLVLLLCNIAAFAEPAPAETETPRTTALTAHFATVEEGKQLMRDRTLFHEQITSSTLPLILLMNINNIIYVPLNLISAV